MEFKFPSPQRNKPSAPVVGASRLSPEMQLALKDMQRVKSMVIELALQAQQLTKKDIASWRAAWQMAINPGNPQRARLYSVYTDVDIDLHLSGCVGQRKGMVLAKKFKVVDKAGKEKPELSEVFHSGWFKDFMELALDSRYWGHSLVQFGDIVTVNGKKRFENVSLVPRPHVIPEFGVIVREVGDEPSKGVSYRDSRLAEWCLEVGKPTDLGLYLKCSPPAISKKNMLAFWDQFGELFGMPIRIGKTTSRDPKEIAKIEGMLTEMAAAAWGLFPEGTDIEIKETTRGDAYNVYDKRVERANSEMSKGILNQTMTIDDGSSRSQGEVHLDVFENVIDADADMIQNVVNDKLIPFLNMHGFNMGEARFEWDNTISYTPEQQQTIEQTLLLNYDIDPAYFVDKYNIPVTAKKAKPQTNFFD